MKYTYIGIALLLLLTVCTPAQSQETAGQGGGRHSVKLLRTGQIGCYDDKGKAVEFEHSGQDGEQQRGEVWPLPRFELNKDGTVLDKMTGFVWLGNGKCFSGLNWLAAGKKIAMLNSTPGICKGYSGNYKDWMVPDLSQLASLLNADTVPADYLRAQGFKHVQAGSYWTSTGYQNLLTAWTVNLGDGTIIFQDKLEKLFLLPVRRSTAGGQGDEAGKAAPARFSSGADGTITDGQTGLMWLGGDCLSRLDWNGALAVAGRLNAVGKIGGCAKYSGKYNDWVLPNRSELLSLVDYGRDYPALYPGSFGSAVSGGEYWSSTSLPPAPENAYVVNFDDGSLKFSAKGDKHDVLLVRRLDSSPLPPRLESEKAAGNLNINPDYLLSLAPELHSDIVWPPSPRFLENGDGTSMDRLTGINWLSDGNCFGRKDWQAAKDVLKKFNSDPRKFDCKGYDGSFGDWELPAVDEMHEMINPDVDDTAAWLNTQGVINVQSGGDYWSRSETLINLYYAKVLRFKGKGSIMPYPKSLNFFVWPHREMVADKEQQPFLSLTVNAMNDALELKQAHPISLVVFLHTFGLTFPADFWLWYDTPDGHQLWLSGIRSWNEKMTPVYQGALFNMRNYEIYRSLANSLAPGKYVFHFAVDTTPDGVLDNARYEVKVPVTISAQ